MDFTTDYAGGNKTTTTPGSGIGDWSPLPNANLGALAALAIQKKQADEQRMRQMQLQALRPVAPIQQEQPVEDPLARQARHSDLQAVIEKNNAASQGPPMKWTYPWGSPGFLTMDPEHMNAYQRADYLPQGSAMGPDHGPGPTAAEDLFTSKLQDQAVNPREPDTRADFGGLISGAARDKLELERQRQLEALRR